MKQLQSRTALTRNLRLGVLVWLVTLLGLGAAGLAAAETKGVKSYTTVGGSWVSGDNIASARGNAIADGLAAAVHQAAIETVPLETLVENFQPINQRLLNNADRFVRGYKVLTEARSDKHYRVLVQVGVALDAISADLSEAGLMAASSDLPAVFLLVAEKRGRDIWPQLWRGEDHAFLTPLAEDPIKTALGEKKLAIISRAGHMDVLQTTDLTLEPDFDPPQVVELGRRLQAKVIVVGQAEAAETPNRMEGERSSYRGVVRLKAFATESGTLLASIAQAAVVIGDNAEDGLRQALLTSGQKAGRDIAAQIVAAWQKRSQKPTTINMVVSGTRYLGPFVRFRRAVGDIARVKQMQMTEMKSNEATLVVDFQGDAQALADAILLKSFESFHINITEVTTGHLKVELVVPQ